MPGFLNAEAAAKLADLSCWLRRLLPVLLCLLATQPLRAKDSFNWDTNRNRVSVDIQAGKLSDLLEKIATATGWQVFVEPETLHAVSAKFKNLAPGEALGLLLGDVSFALVPETNATARLYVFRTARQNATQLVRAVRRPGAKRIDNELVVRLKPGMRIEDLARQLGARIVGRLDRLNAYRLRFDDAAAAEAAREQLANNPDVAAVDNNYEIDRPPGPNSSQAAGLLPRLELKPPPDSGRVVVGLIDTAVQPLGNNLDQFLQKQVSVAGEAQTDVTSPTHGTAMADAILRSLQGVTQGSTSVQILPIDVYGPNEATSTFDVANGIATAVNSGAKVINLSLGSPSSSGFLNDIIAQARSLGILLIASAGNNGDTTDIYPAALNGVDAVTAMEQGRLPPYANRGSFVSLAAPGSLLLPFGSQTFYVQGTSVSSAYLSGIAAGYMDANQATAAQADSYLHNTFGVRITTGK